LLTAGEWMNTSAGLAFTPHVIHISVGEVMSSLVLLPICSDSPKMLLHPCQILKKKMHFFWRIRLSQFCLYNLFLHMLQRWFLHPYGKVVLSVLLCWFVHLKSCYHILPNQARGWMRIYVRYYHVISFYMYYYLMLDLICVLLSYILAIMVQILFFSVEPRVYWNSLSTPQQ